MEIRIGVQHVGREVVLESEQTAEEVRALVDAAIADGSVLSLADAKGRQVVVPGDRIGFVEIGARKSGPLGFAAV
ncbi:DUF3107 domain-containing protein [Micrococcus flavus]|uniref:Polysaccharide deacetylase 2 family uncharacterized protein YibQ n=1 Tax=Micrococcus flavus TaxID=384602 RepID=A0A4Y8X273_9MICC|nr:DUF3107 domain-containing protein [Micrococcus flavus]MBB4882341.1 polysaccharide deacetylase 2 family uncharacterized protein YibQ [Micrococcus flavus]TFI03475.1 DUF3107 domain-containing protein [Micrococcus flavus]GGK49407.1 ATP-binding protein [Micrococcus flavus]